MKHGWTTTSFPWKPLGKVILLYDDQSGWCIMVYPFLVQSAPYRIIWIYNLRNENIAVEQKSEAENNNVMMVTKM